MAVVIGCPLREGLGRRSNPLLTGASNPGGMTADRHGTSEQVCDVAGCSKPAERSINIKQASRSKLRLKDEGVRSVHLCKEHYKEYKKETKRDRELDQVYDRWTSSSSGRRPRSLPSSGRPRASP